MGVEDAAEEGKEQTEQRSGRTSADVVLGAVMVVTAAVFCVLLSRSPVVRTAAAGKSEHIGVLGHWLAWCRWPAWIH